MKNKSSAGFDIEARFAEINALEPEVPTKEDLEAIEKAMAENPDNTVTLEEWKAKLRPR